MDGGEKKRKERSQMAIHGVVDVVSKVGMPGGGAGTLRALCGDRATNERSHCRISRTILEITEGIQRRAFLLYESCTEANICMYVEYGPKIRLVVVVVWSVIYLADDKQL